MLGATVPAGTGLTAAVGVVLLLAGTGLVTADALIGASRTLAFPGTGTAVLAAVGVVAVLVETGLSTLRGDTTAATAGTTTTAGAGERDWGCAAFSGDGEVSTKHKSR